MDETTILAGAHFQIWDQAKTQVREGTVDATGVITWVATRAIHFGGDKAPEGYTVSDEVKAESLLLMKKLQPKEHNQPLLKTMSIKYFRKNG